MSWKWDERKARANLSKHDVFFEIAALVFDDPWQLSEPDPHPDDDRWRTIGMVEATTLLVVHTIEDESGTGRIISARKASKAERRRYEQDRH